MATGLMIASSAVGLAGGIKGAMDGKSAAKDAKKLGKLNARLIMQETEQQIKNIERTGEQQQGNIKAQAGAGGVKQEGSVQGFMDEQRARNQEASDWAMSSGKQRAKIAKMGGQSAANTAQSQGQQQLYSGVAGAVRGVNSAGVNQDWWS